MRPYPTLLSVKIERNVFEHSLFFSYVIFLLEKSCFFRSPFWCSYEINFDDEMKNSQFGNKIGYFWNSTEYILGRVDIKIEILDLLGKLVEIEKKYFLYKWTSDPSNTRFWFQIKLTGYEALHWSAKTFLRLVTTCYLQRISHDSWKKIAFRFPNLFDFSFI